MSSHPVPTTASASHHAPVAWRLSLRGLRALVLCTLFACSGGHPRERLQVGSEAGDQGGGGAGVSGNAPARDGGVGSNWQALSVHVEDIDDMTVEVITLSCAGACAEVEAVASGGNPPYAFEWDDGSTEAQRRVCLDASTTLSVGVTDTAIDQDEFHYDAQTATTHVTATVLDCGDGGIPAEAELCLTNGSFEGTARGVVSTAAPWNTCGTLFTDNTVIWDSSAFTSGWQLTPTDGATQLVTATNGGVGAQGATQALCAPLEAGTTYAFRIDLASPIEGQGSSQSQPGTLQIWSGNSDCMQSELLWISPALGPSWTTECVTVTPTQAGTHLTLTPTVGGDAVPLTRIAVDHIVPVVSCP